MFMMVQRTSPEMLERIITKEYSIGDMKKIELSGKGISV